MGYAINSVGGWRWVDTSAGVVAGETYSATVPVATPTLAQSAAIAAVSGLTITLTGSVTLAATLFPTDVVTQSKIGAVITTLAATGAFPGGGSSYPMKDASDAWHTFTAAEYRTVAGAISTYVAACDLIADGNPMSATSLPASSVTLTV